MGEKTRGGAPEGDELIFTIRTAQMDARHLFKLRYK